MSGSTPKPTKWHCETCDCYFQRKFALEKHCTTRRHKDNVKDRETPVEILELQEKYERVVIENQQLRNDHEKLKSNYEKLQNQIAKRNTTTYTGNANHYENCNINNIQINLTINPHGSENWDYLKHEVVSLMKGVNTCIPEMVKKLHFHKDYPENHNVKLPNKRGMAMETYDGEQWHTSHKKDVIEAMIIQLVDKLEDEYGEDFRNQSTNFIQRLWEQKTGKILEEQKIDRNLRRQVEFSIMDGQTGLKN